MTGTVQTFFYGGLINPEVMDRVGLTRRSQAVAAVQGYRIVIRPWVNLVPASLSTSFGVLMQVTHDELSSVYAKLAVPYFPYPVVARTGAGLVPALTYLAGKMEERVADLAHIEPLLRSAEQLDFPSWYVNEIRAFLPANAES